MNNAQKSIASSLLLSLLGSGLTAAMAETTPASGAKRKDIEFTKVQDLSPDSKPLNRPIRQKWAVVIGVGRFSDHRLNNPGAKDLDETANRFAKFLTDSHGGRFEPNHVRVLINNLATQKSITNTLGPKWLGSGAGPDDLVVVFVASQAFPTTDGNTYLCGYNCDIENIYGTCVSMQDMMKTLKESVKSDRVVLILEAPYSGSAELASGAHHAPSSASLDLNKIILGKGYMIMTAGKSDQAVKGTTFSTNLLTALSEQDGLVPLQEAFAHARQATEQQTSNKQTPELKSDWSGSDMILGAVPLEKLTDVPETVKSFLGAETHYLKASTLMSTGDVSGALVEYKAAVATDPDYGDAVADYGVALFLQGKLQESAQQLKHAVEVNPDDALYHLNYARVLSKLHMEDDCIKQLERAYSINPRDRVIVSAMVDKCISRRQVGRAQEMLEEALVVYPTVASLHDKMAFVLQLQGEHQKALAEAQQAVQLDGKLPSARINLGSLLLASGAVQDAATQFQEATTLAPLNRDAFFGLGMAQDKCGKKTEASAALKQFLELAPQNDIRRQEVQQTLDRLAH